jgi:CspA family cold shock protein
VYTPAVRYLPVLVACPLGIPQDNAEIGLGAARWSRSHGADRRFHRRPDMAQGTVKFFNTQKGFGFIQPTDGGKDVFVHISAVERAGMSTLNEGQKVSYDVVSERGKFAAANLQTI